MVDALVLSGGASHGDFEVGAVRRLFEAGFQPAIIVSASVGSINAIKLCETGALAVADAPSGLEQIWLTKLQANSSMYVKNPDFNTGAFNQPALAAVQGLAGKLGDDYNWRNILGRTAGDAGIGATAGSVLGPFGTAAGALIGTGIGLASSIINSGNDLQALANAAQPLIDALQGLEKAQSIYTIDPINTLLLQNIDPAKVASSPIRLLMAVVSLESGDLRYVTGKGAVMTDDTQTPYSELYSVSLICQPLLDAYNSAVDDLKGVGGPGDYTTYAAWHAALVRAQTEVATAKAALDACRRANPSPVKQPVTCDVRTGALASASIPMVFKPVKIGPDNYVDGGTRNQLPITGAIMAGATRIWAVDCNHPGIGPALDPFSGNPVGSFDTANFLQIAERAAADIMPNQLELDDDAAAGTRSAAVTLVQPELDIHTGLTVDPGLIRIRMAHGYMRTDDVMLAQVVFGDTASVDSISGALYTTQIVNQRYQIWVREHAAVRWTLNTDPDGTVQPPTAPEVPSTDWQALADVRRMKLQLRQLMTARVNGLNLDGSPITLNGKQLKTLFGPNAPGGRVPEQPIPSSAWSLQWEEHQIGVIPPLIVIGARQVAFSAVAPQLWGSRLWHTMRRANGTWTGLGDVQGQFAVPGPVAAVSATSDGVAGETQFMFTA